MRNKYFRILIPTLFAFILLLFIYVSFLKRRSLNNSFIIYPTTTKVGEVLKLIKKGYVDTVNQEQLEEVAINKILEKLDPHSVYIPARDFKEFNEPLDGNFEGIGVQFNIQNDTILVVKTIENGPSAKVGILGGDKIVKVNDSIVAGTKLTNLRVMKLLKGPKGSLVKVGILRHDENSLIDFEITRDKIPLYSIDVAYEIRKGIGYVKISKFSRTTYFEFMKAVMQLKEKGITKLIIDLRHNTGGFLDIAIRMVDELLPKGQMIVYTEGRTQPKKEFFSEKEGACKDLEIAVLINEVSASASEILAGAVQDNDRGIIIGRRSFGKGLVQTQQDLSDGSAIRLTIARYHTPSGRCIQKPYDKGIEKYHMEIYERVIKNDTVSVPDSLKYKTLKGRVVYGGGGITPDIHVDVDTTNITTYYMKARRKGLIYRFALKYSDSQRAKLEKVKDYENLRKELAKVNIYSQFKAFAKKNKVTPKNSKEFNTSKSIIETQLKAYIIRNFLDEKYFYKEFEVLDDGIQAALKELQ